MIYIDLADTKALIDKYSSIVEDIYSMILSVPLSENSYINEGKLTSWYKVKEVVFYITENIDDFNYIKTLIESNKLNFENFQNNENITEEYLNGPMFIINGKYMKLKK